MGEGGSFVTLKLNLRPFSDRVNFSWFTSPDFIEKMGPHIDEISLFTEIFFSKLMYVFKFQKMKLSII